MGPSGLTDTTQQILQGTWDATLYPDLPNSAQYILAELKQQRQTIPTTFTIDQMANGFHKWRESTSTSPSGKHLGIYRTLTKYYLYPPKPHARRNGTSIDSQTEEKYQESLQHHQTAKLALTIQHLLITEAIKRTHTLQRWKTIHNFFLEKLPGQPLIEKLRVIHLYEADWNIILKFFIAYQLNFIACKERTVAPEQAGGRPGKNAADTATAIVLVNETILLQRLLSAILYNDAKACFDRIIENISNLSLLAEGLHPQITDLHTQTLALAKYYIKTQYGIGQIPNGHMDPEPFYGTGQGAADSMPRWGILSDKAIKAYNKHATSEPINSPFHTASISLKIRAFVDDTNCPTVLHSRDLAHLKQTVQNNTKLWESLLHTIGGKLELTKCKFSVFNWQTNSLGTTTLQTDTQIGSIQIEDSETHTNCEIAEIPPNEAYKLLGTQMTLTGDTTAQETMLKEKCLRMTKLFAQAPLDTNDVRLGYTTVILPTLKYGLGASAIPWYTLDSIQKPLIHTLLPKMGINRHMPLAAVYAPEHYGGLGIQQLAAEQGIAHTQFIIGSVRSATDDRQTVLTLLESYIVTSGITGNPLENMMPVTYIDAQWMESTRIFLNSIQATIHIRELHTIRPIRSRDQGIMELACHTTANNKQLIMINNCRLWLQVHTIAEITTMDGTQIQHAAYHGTEHPLTTFPQLWSVTKSTLEWPAQQRPPIIAWQAWKRLLKSIIRIGLTLRRPLGRPYPHLSLHPRIWLTPTPLMTTPTNPRPAKQNALWSDDIHDQYIASTRIDIILHSTAAYETSAFSWVIISDLHTHLLSQKASCPPTLYAARNQPLLLALCHCLTTITKELNYRHTIQQLKPINIWLQCRKTLRKCINFQHMFHTASSGMKEEADIYRHITQHIKGYPRLRLHRLTNTSPDPVQAGFDLISLHPTDIPLITTHYEGPPPSATLTIDTHIVTCNTADALRSAYTSQQYRTYLQDKHSWDDDTTDNIDWQVLSYAISQFSGTKKKTLQQFIHQWLPTNAHKSQEKTHPHDRCPQCNQSLETNAHFLQCPADHDNWTATIDNVLRSVHRTSPQILLDLLRVALIHPESLTVMGRADEETPIQLFPLCTAQAAIGWDQLLRGRWSRAWAHTYDKLTKSNDGVKWASRLLKLVWAAVLEKWRRRCDAAHDTTAATDSRDNNTANIQITTIYESITLLDSIDRKLLHSPIDQIKQMPLKQKRAWIRRVQPHVLRGIQRAKQRQKFNTRPLTDYFTPMTAPTPNAQPRLQPNARANAADYNPP